MREPVPPMYIPKFKRTCRRLPASHIIVSSVPRLNSNKNKSTTATVGVDTPASAKRKTDLRKSI